MNSAPPGRSPATGAPARGHAIAIAPIRSRLPRLAPHDERGARRLLALLARAELRATRRPMPPEGTSRGDAPAWIRMHATIGEVLFAPIQAAGRPVAVVPRKGLVDAIAMAAALEAIEPLVAALEVALGSPLSPLTITAQEPAGLLVVDVSVAAGYAARLALPAAAADRLPEPRFDHPPSWLHGQRVACSVVLGESLLAGDEARALEPGDLLLCPAAYCQPWRVGLRPPGGLPARAALYQPLAGHLTLAAEEYRPMMNPAAHAAPPTQPSGTQVSWDRLPVRLRFELPDVPVDLGTLAGVQPGAVIEVAPAAGPVMVRIFADTTPVGEGELVALGDGYGVRITALEQPR
jgi:flagellar motor switch/type III secretory pathway protein FliN